METTLAADRVAAGSGRTLTAVFESEAEAQRAVAALTSTGINDARVYLGGTDVPAHGDRADASGFWERLIGFFMPADDGSLYAEGLRRGHVLLTVDALPPAQEAQAVEILEAAGALDLEERSTAWRSEGWAPDEVEPYAPGGTAGMTGPEEAPVAEEQGHQPGGTAGMTGYVATDAEKRALARRDTALQGGRVRAYDR